VKFMRVAARCSFAKLVAVTAALFVSAVVHGQQSMRAEADAAMKKFERIAAAAETPRPADAPPLETTLTEREINSYLELEGPSFLPEGIASPRFTLGDGGRVRARAIIDLDVWGSGRERSLFDPLSFLTGDVEVIATGRIETRDGNGVVRYDSVTVGGISVPKVLAQELVRFYTRSPDFPDGITFDQPYPLPEGVRAVSVVSSEATLTQ
jgi:hypothetical protein